MKILIACEFSGIVREEFRKLGYDAWSCDLLPTKIPGQHIQDDVLKHLKDGWDLMIAHPPCTHLAVSGARHFKEKIADGRQQKALEFIRSLLNAPIKHIALENPVGIISTKIRKPEQIIQPNQFGDEAQKTTCLWLKNLPKLKPTKIVGKGEFVTFKSGKKHPKWYSKLYGKGKERSITFKGIGEAMAKQWGDYIKENLGEK